VVVQCGPVGAGRAPRRSRMRPTASGRAVSGGRAVGGCWKLGVKLTTVMSLDQLEVTPASREDRVGWGKEM
jgi:hypothetical protein